MWVHSVGLNPVLSLKAAVATLDIDDARINRPTAGTTRWKGDVSKREEQSGVPQIGGPSVSVNLSLKISIVEHYCCHHPDFY